MTYRYTPLTIDQITAIRAYQKSKGRNWKQNLSLDWQSGNIAGSLYSLRNTHGPSWLQSFRLPQREG